VIIADTSGLLAFFNQREAQHADVIAVVTNETDPLVVSPFVIAELDYLIATRLGVPAELSAVRELAGGAYDIAHLDARELGACSDLIERYADQNIGIADASLVVLAERYQTKRLLTLDQRHFNVIRPISGGRFRLLPSRENAA
jgi:uncharacterized protein